jgi:hypothetical protein
MAASLAASSFNNCGASGGIRVGQYIASRESFRALGACDSKRIELFRRLWPRHVDPSTNKPKASGPVNGYVETDVRTKKLDFKHMSAGGQIHSTVNSPIPSAAIKDPL